MDNTKHQSQYLIHHTHITYPFFLFFQFLGELFYHLIINYKFIRWRKSIFSTLHIGALITMPLITVSMLLGIVLVISIQIILGQFNLQKEALNIAQTILLRDFAPFPIAFVLC